MDLSTFDSIHCCVNNGEYEWKTKKTKMLFDKCLRRKFVILNGTETVVNSKLKK